MPTRLLLIAHGATAATRRAAFPLDEALEPAARDAAARLAEVLGRADRIYCAPERRTMETAEALGLAHEPEPILPDIDLGRWRGRMFDEMLATDPEALAAWTSDSAYRAHGGESVEQLIERVGPWLDREREQSGRVLAVTHPAIIRACICVALGSPGSSFWRIDIGPLTRVDLRSDGRRWALRAILPGE